MWYHPQAYFLSTKVCIGCSKIQAAWPDTFSSSGCSKARAVLSDPRTTQSISAISENLCFADASSFSRAFRREFGYGPSEVRSAALVGLALGATPQHRGLSDRADLSALLRGF